MTSGPVRASRRAGDGLLIACWLFTDYLRIGKSVSSSRNHAYGGGLGMNGGRAAIFESTWRETFVNSTTQEAWGGGIGLLAGTVELYNSTIAGASVISTINEAFGGGLGIGNGGTAKVYDSTIVDCFVDGGTTGYGSGVGAPFPGTPVEPNVLFLSNVSILEARAVSPLAGRSSPIRGVALFAAPENVVAALLTVVNRADGGVVADPNTSLIGTGGSFGPGGKLLLRQLVIDAPNFTRPVDDDTELRQCDDGAPGEICGPSTVCTTWFTNTSGGLPIESPSCACAPPDVTKPFVSPIPGPEAHSAALAPYTLDIGCVAPDGAPVAPAQMQPDEWELNPNWWRASSTTDDVRMCLKVWQPGALTPCRGGNGSDYCEPGRGLTGPMCRVCARADHYFDMRRASCELCPVTGGMALLQSFSLVLGLCAIAFGLLYGLQQMRRRKCGCGGLTRWAEQGLATCMSFFDAIGVAEVLVPRLGLVGKAKLCIGYYQIVKIMPEAFDVALPEECAASRRATAAPARPGMPSRPGTPRHAPARPGTTAPSAADTWPGRLAGTSSGWRASTSSRSSGSSGSRPRPSATATLGCGCASSPSVRSCASRCLSRSRCFAASSSRTGPPPPRTGPPLRSPRRSMPALCSARRRPTERCAPYR